MTPFPYPITTSNRTDSCGCGACAVAGRHLELRRGVVGAGAFGQSADGDGPGRVGGGGAVLVDLLVPAAPLVAWWRPLRTSLSRSHIGIA